MSLRRTTGFGLIGGKFWARHHDNLLRGLSLVLFVIGWWIAAVFFTRVLPEPGVVAVEIVDILVAGDFLYHFYNTAYRVGSAFIFSIFAATVIGTVMGLNSYTESLFEPYVLVGLTFPGMAVAMISLILFGFGNIAIIITLCAVIIPLMTINIWQGAKNIDTELVRMGHAFNAPRVKIIREVVLPQLVPYFFAASRFGLAFAWKLVILAEMLGATNGVGFRITESFELFNLAGVIGWTITFLAVMAIVEYGIIKPIENRLTRWRSDVEGGALL